jgi:hypothetical protein
MTFTNNWPNHKHKKNLGETKKSIPWTRFGAGSSLKKHTEVSMEEVRQQALMLSAKGFPPGLKVKSITVPEQSKRKERPKVPK